MARTGIGVKAFLPHQQWPAVGSQWPAYNVESDQAQGLVAWWPTLASANQRSIRDLLAGGHHASLSSGVAWAWDQTLGWVMEFTGGGTADNITITDHADLQIAGGDFSFAFWFAYTQASDIFSRFINYRYAGDNGYGFQLYAGNPGRIAFHVRRGGVESHARTTTMLTPNTLTLVTGVMRGAVPYIYINGVDATFDAGGSTINTPNLQLGAPSLTNELVGLIGGVRLHDCALTDAEAWNLHDPATRWELHEIPRHTWAMRWVEPAAPPPVAGGYMTPWRGWWGGVQ